MDKAKYVSSDRRLKALRTVKEQGMNSGLWMCWWFMRREVLCRNAYNYVSNTVPHSFILESSRI